MTLVDSKEENLDRNTAVTQIFPRDSTDRDTKQEGGLLAYMLDICAYRNGQKFGSMLDPCAYMFAQKRCLCRILRSYRKMLVGSDVGSVCVHFRTKWTKFFGYRGYMGSWEKSDARRARQSLFGT
jgi:hypothetical protein